MKSRVFVLCEDKQQQTFVRRILKQLGFENHHLRFAKLPAGKGAGEQFVRKNYPDEVKEYRQKAPANAVSLLVIIDSDLLSLNERHKQLNDELVAKQMVTRQQDEHIPILIPKRNIETWIHYLWGEQVNETDTYPKLKKESDCWTAADKLVSYYRSNLPSTDVPSHLREGVEELKERLPSSS
ncbi:MAG: hypothetical protein SF097_01365 [Acidobacteriota bacterium]|nr:hypothetical protein [Acidobacteriota bacterium]